MTLIVLFILFWAVPVHAGTLVDMVGRQVEIQTPPRRIVSLAPSLTEILFALGAGEAVVGVTDFDNYPPEVREKRSVGGGIDPNLEVIVALRPDVVFVAADANRWGTLVQLERLNIPVYGVKSIGVEGVFDSIAKVGEAVGRRQQAEALIAKMRRRLNAVSEKVGKRDKPKVLYAVWIDPLIVAGRETVIHDLIRLAGGVNAVRERGFPRLGLEAVFNHPPDLIVLAFDQGGLGYREVLPHLPGWRDIPAVRQGAIRVIDANVMNRPGPRIVEAVEVLARALHPEVFGEGGR